MSITATNDVTGDQIKTKPSSDEYRSGWSRVFGGGKSCSDDDATTGKARENAGLSAINRCNASQGRLDTKGSPPIRRLPLG